MGLYKPPSLKADLFTSELNKALTYYSTTYQNIIVLGDFNMSIDNSKLAYLTESSVVKVLYLSQHALKDLFLHVLTYS